MKYLKFFLCFVFLISIFSFNCFALSASTYADLSPTSSQVQNLVSSANNYKSFQSSDYVVFQDGQYSYRIVWGDDIEVNGNSLSSDKVEVISYVRLGSGFDYTWSYSYTADDTLSLTINHLVVSNIEGVGASSPTFEEYSFQHKVNVLLIFIMAFVGVEMFLAFRRTFR